MKVMRAMCRENFKARYATLSFRINSRHLNSLGEQLGCPVRTRADCSSIAFSRQLLDMPIATANSSLFSLIESYLRQLKEKAHDSIAMQVEAYVWDALPTGKCSMKHCADQLHLSVRTLHKRLMKLGISFSDITREQRLKVAKHLLACSDVTLDDIAERLGYSSQTSFSRAFRTNTGMTPLVFRTHSLKGWQVDGRYHASS